MGFRFHKSFKLAKGINIGLSKSGASISFGVRGLRHTISTSGRQTTTVGLPGTGMSYSKSTRLFGGKNGGLLGSLGNKLKNNENTNNSSKNTSKNTSINTSKNATIPDALNTKNSSANLGSVPRGTIHPDYAQELRLLHTEQDPIVDWARPDEVLVGRHEKEVLVELENHDGGFLSKLFGDSKKTQLEEKLIEARKKDKDTLYELAKKILTKDVDAYFEAIEEFAPLDELLEFGAEFDFSSDDGSILALDINLSLAGIVPNTVSTITKTGRESVKALTKTEYYDLCHDFVGSLAIRAARDLFALLPVDEIYIDIHDQMVNTATGGVENTLILSVCFDLATLDKLIFDKIDPSDALSNFRHNVDFLKTKGFRKVNELEII